VCAAIICSRCRKGDICSNAQEAECARRRRSFTMAVQDHSFVLLRSSRGADAGPVQHVAVERGSVAEVRSSEAPAGGGTAPPEWKVGGRVVRPGRWSGAALVT